MATATIEPEVSTNFEPAQKEALELANQAKAIAVVDNDSYVAAGEMLKAVVDKKKWWSGLVAPAKEAANHAHKRVCALEKAGLDPLEAVEKQLRDARSKFRTEQERLRAEEEARLQAIARKEAEDAARIAAEEAQVQAALAAEQSGDSKAAEEIIAAPVEVAPVHVAPVVIQSTVPKISGFATRKVWKHRVVDEMKIPRQFLMVDESKLRKYATTMQEQAVVEGVEFYPDDSEAVR